MSNDLKAMLADIKRTIADDEFSPTKWESDFLDTVTELINFDLALSDRQDEVFEKLWKKATGQGGVDDEDPDEDDFM